MSNGKWDMANVKWIVFLLPFAICHLPFCVQGAVNTAALPFEISNLKSQINALPIANLKSKIP